MSTPIPDEQAIRVLRAAALPVATKNELYELYLEDVEEHSEATALEKLDAAIRDEQE